MVQGVPQVAGRFPDEIRLYKAPPPEISSEQFNETDAARGFARGFSIQTVSPLPIAWAEHAAAEGHWGPSLRKYMRDYNHGAVVGMLHELLQRPENRVTLAEDRDERDLPVALSITRNATTTGGASRSAFTLPRKSGRGRVRRTCSRSPDTRNLIGGCRMGLHPDDSVCDRNQRNLGGAQPACRRWQRVPDEGAANPALTIMALASRLAEHLANPAAHA